MGSLPDLLAAYFANAAAADAAGGKAPVAADAPAPGVDGLEADCPVAAAGAEPVAIVPAAGLRVKVADPVPQAAIAAAGDAPRAMATHGNPPPVAIVPDVVRGKMKVADPVPQAAATTTTAAITPVAEPAAPAVANATLPRVPARLASASPDARPSPIPAPAALRIRCGGGYSPLRLVHAAYATGCRGCRSLSVAASGTDSQQQRHQQQHQYQQHQQHPPPQLQPAPGQRLQRVKDMLAEHHKVAAADVVLPPWIERHVESGSTKGALAALLVVPLVSCLCGWGAFTPAIADLCLSRNPDPLWHGKSSSSSRRRLAAWSPSGNC